MMDDKTVPNQTRDLSFADDFIFAKLVEDVHDYPVEDAVVVNVSPSAMITGDEHPAIVPAWKSTWLKGGQIKSAEREGAKSHQSRGVHVPRLGLAWQSNQEFPTRHAAVYFPAG
ncbi:hypothetical protein [Mesorhizobium sp.]|uniref:hypothetical protein n=1 Tax=Mesorhizobium sp. TaxID=1871066 RepID=UPI0025FD28F1|nr:hypothetical protein [Mesorhizobium sp.]